MKHSKKKISILLFLVIVMCGCENNTDEKLENCCRYNGGFIENGKCVDYYSDYDFNNCMKEDNAKYGASTKEGQERRACCIDNGGKVSTNGNECSISNDDKQYLDNCLNNLK